MSSLVKMGIKTPEQIKDQAVHLYLVEGFSLEKTAEKLKTSKPNILNICKARGVKLRSKSQAAQMRIY